MSFFRFSKSPKSEGSTTTGFNFKQKKSPEEFRVHLAVRDEKQDLVQELVTRYGYDINEADNTGETPLLVSLRCRFEHMAVFLIENGADPSIGNAQILRMIVDKAKSKHVAIEGEELKVVTPEELAKNLGLHIAHAAIVEAQARIRLESERALHRAAEEQLHPHRRKSSVGNLLHEAAASGATPAAGYTSDTTATSGGEGGGSSAPTLKKKLTERELVSQETRHYHDMKHLELSTNSAFNVHSPPDQSPHSVSSTAAASSPRLFHTGAPTASPRHSNLEDKMPVVTEVHPMMARRSSGVRRMSAAAAKPTTPTATPAPHAAEGLGKYLCTAGACDGAQCVIM